MSRTGPTANASRCLLRANDQLKAMPAAQWAERFRGKPLQKARAHELFLGLGDYGWLDSLGEATVMASVADGEGYERF